MKKYKIVAIYVMLGVLFASPLTVEAKRGVPMDRGKGGGKQIGDWHRGWFLSLDLNDDILRKMQELRLENKTEILELRNQIEKKELEIEKVLLDKKLDFDKILSIHDEISDLRRKIGRKRLEEKIEMYKLIPDDKKEEAKNMFLHRFLGKRHERPGMYGSPGMHMFPMNK